MWDFHINTNVFDVKVNKQMRPEMFYANPSNPALIGKSQMSKQINTRTMIRPD